MRRATDPTHLFHCIAWGRPRNLEVAAQSRLAKSEPSARSVINAAPRESKLWFNENVEPAFATVQAQEIPLTSHDDRSNRKLLIVSLPNSPPAGLVALDSHEADNKLTFTIKIPA
jgi:copper resistance protein C